jgi:hypothetical protein
MIEHDKKLQGFSLTGNEALHAPAEEVSLIARKNRRYQIESKQHGDDTSSS